jgi:hypothetical protein
MKPILTLSLILFAFKTFAQTFNPNHNLIGFYSFENNAKDSSYNQHHGLNIGGGTYVPGIRNSGISLNGSSQYVNISSTDCITSIDTAFTLSGWVYTRSLSSWPTWLAFFSKGSGSQANSSAWAILYQYNTHPSIRFVDPNNNLYEEHYPAMQSGIDLNQWNFFAWTFSKGRIKFYKNGILIGQDNIPFQRFRMDQNPVQIGRDQPGADEHFDGVMDEFCMYNYALSASEIQELYQNKGCIFPANGLIRDTICQGQTSNGFNQTGKYNIAVQNETSCIAYQELDLTVIPQDTISSVASICQGQTFTFFGNSITTPGTYFHTLTLPNGCQETQQLSVSTGSFYPTQTITTICPNDTIFFNNQAITTAGTYQDTLFSATGCDTLVNLIVTVEPSIISTINASFCPNESYQFGPQTLTAPGSYQRIIQGQNGDCDTTVQLILTQTTPYTLIITDSICALQTYSFQGTNYTAPGVYVGTLAGTGNDCDTIVQINLSLVNEVLIQITDSICKGDTYLFGNQTLTSPGVYSRSLPPGITGCDTTIQLTLNTQNIYTDTSLFICDNDTLLVGNLLINAAGIYTDTLSGAPCDTILTINVQAAPNITRQLDTVFCNGKTIEIFGVIYDQPGNFQDIIPGILGCDTMLIISIKAAQDVDIQLDTVLCSGETIVINGVVYDQIGTFQDTIAGIFGCDTILTLQIAPPNTFQPFLPRDTVLCGLSGITLSSPYPATQWGALGTGSQIFIQNPDTLIYTVTDSLGCSFVDTIQISTCCGNTEIYVPNAFKPGSIENFGFQPYVRGNCKLSHYEIYDRWGALIFRSRTDEDQWLGLSARGEKLNSAVFTYVIYLVDTVTQRKSVVSGDVTLVR